MQISSIFGGIFAPQQTNSTNNANAVSQVGRTNISQIQNVTTNNTIIQLGETKPIEQCLCGITAASKHDSLSKIMELVGALLAIDMLMKFMDAVEQLASMLSPTGYNNQGIANSGEIYIMGSRGSKDAIIGVPSGSNYAGFAGPQLLKTDGQTVESYPLP